MTPAERKFDNIEEGLMRAQALARVLRNATDGAHDQLDAPMWAGVYLMACEIEDALDKAAEAWTKARDLIPS